MNKSRCSEAIAAVNYIRGEFTNYVKMDCKPEEALERYRAVTLGLNPWPKRAVIAAILRPQALDYFNLYTIMAHY